VAQVNASVFFCDGKLINSIKVTGMRVPATISMERSRAVQMKSNALNAPFAAHFISVLQSSAQTRRNTTRITA